MTILKINKKRKKERTKKHLHQSGYFNKQYVIIQLEVDIAIYFISRRFKCNYDDE